MSDYFRRVDLTVMYPPFVQLIQKLQANCLARGAEYYATSGMRTVNEQEALYALGRTKANVDATPEKPLGGVVTNARGGQSYHNFGIAVDFALDKDKTRAGLQPDWSPWAYGVLGEEAAKLGLEWGGVWTSFKDYPHVQLNIGKVGLNLATLRTAYVQGYPAVYASLNRYRW